MSFVRSFLPLSAVLCLLALSSCESAEHVPGAFPTQGQVVATVNGQRITRPMMDAVLRTLPANLRAQVEKTENASSLMEGLVTSEIMYHEAMKAGLDDYVVKTPAFIGSALNATLETVGKPVSIIILEETTELSFPTTSLNFA